MTLYNKAIVRSTEKFVCDEGSFNSQKHIPPPNILLVAKALLESNLAILLQNSMTASETIITEIMCAKYFEHPKGQYNYKAVILLREDDRKAACTCPEVLFGPSDAL